MPKFVFNNMFKNTFSEPKMVVAKLWPPATPLLGKLSIVLGTDMLQAVMATVDAGRIKYLFIGICLEMK